MSDAPQDHNLEGLLRTIRQEGVDRAQQEAERILADARAQAAGILRAAEEESERLLRETEAALRTRQAADRAALERAARDTVLGVRAELARTLEALLRRECRDALTGDFLRELIARAAAGHADGRPLEVSIGERDREFLLNGALARLREQVQGGLELRVHPGVSAGFRIGSVGDAFRLELTDDALAEALAAVVTPRFAALFEALRAGEPKP